MDDPAKILEKIMKFEELYTPQFNNLIKQSLIDTVSLHEDDNVYAHSSPRPPNKNNNNNDNMIPIITNSKSSTDEYEPELPTKHNNTDKQAPYLFASLSHPVPMPSQQTQTKPTHQHKQTPIFKREPTPNKVQLVDPQNFIANLPSDLVYNSDEDESDEHDQHTHSQKSSGSVQYHLSDYDDNDLNGDDDDYEEEEPQHPLIEEYDNVSHQIHLSKLKLRKLDRKITMAQRQSTSSSNLVKEHSDIKIKIAQLISRRRELETNDVVRNHLKEDDTPEVVFEVNGMQQIDNKKQTSTFLDGGLDGINEDEEDEDEDEDENENKTLSPTVTTNDSERDLTENLEDSKQTLELDGFDYDYNDQHYDEDEEDDEDEDNASVKINSDVDSDDEEDESSDGGGSMVFNEDAEQDENWVDDMNMDDIPNGDEDDNENKNEEEEQRHKGHNEEEEEEEEEEYESSDGGGSMVFNEEADQNENWVENMNMDDIPNGDGDGDEDLDDDDEDNASIEVHSSEEVDIDNNDDQDQEKEKGEEKENEINIPNGRNRRKEEMKRHRNYKNAEKTDLSDLKEKYLERRRNREQIQINKAFDLSDLTRGGDIGIDDDDGDIDAEAIELNMMRYTQQRTNNYHITHEQDNNNEYDNDFDIAIPALPKKKSVLLDIDKFSNNLAAVIEEDDDEEDEDEDEKYFQTIEYQTDSDCDSNDSIVIKKEVPKLVSVNDLQKFDTV